MMGGKKVPLLPVALSSPKNQGSVSLWRLVLEETSRSTFPFISAGPRQERDTFRSSYPDITVRVQVHICVE